MTDNKEIRDGVVCIGGTVTLTGCAIGAGATVVVIAGDEDNDE
ncbi:hypothetical protein [Streptosporangium sp. NPDC004631]